MATITRKRNPLMFGGAAPFGNLTALAFTLATTAAGAVVDSNSTAAVASGDVIELGLLPGGMRLDDAQVIITTGMTESVTGSLGFKYADGVNSTEVPQDAAYFISAGALSSAVRLRANGTKLVTLPKDAILTLTTGGAANAKASDIKVVVSGELTGPR
ncbi:hypothetical protein HYG93_07380 [Acinetobacter sp. SwsAc6]|uniref:hypothetical protein n=1 Tax=Acinetobacter TaxID=469 RepID=UPI000EA36ED6|nr:MULTISPECIES: hypothetical protein [Acinetobacter]NWK74110.1 hypothetical protein [Acinetobacter sp. SwsAc6]RKG50789.1 hypothetical protein D7V68_02470 [Acinetobacter cumulans]